MFHLLYFWRNYAWKVPKVQKKEKLRLRLYYYIKKLYLEVKTQTICFKTQEKTQNSRIKLKNSASHYSLDAEKMAKKQAWVRSKIFWVNPFEWRSKNRKKYTVRNIFNSNNNNNKKSKMPKKEFSWLLRFFTLEFFPRRGPKNKHCQLF